MAIIAALAAMAILLLVLVPDTTAWLAWGVHKRAIQLLLWVASGMVCYFAVLRLMGVRPGEMTAPA